MRMFEKPLPESLVSVVIPCYNQGRWLQDCIDSALASTYRNVEVIVVDDGSTDSETIRVLNSLTYKGVKVVRQANAGVCVARNKAIEMASGEFVLPLDGDDLLAPTFIEHAMRIFDQDPNVGQVGSNCELFGDGETDTLVHGIPSGYVGHAIMSHMFLTVTSIVRKCVWKMVGGFPLFLNRMALEDVYFTMRVHAMGGQAYYLDEVGCRYRQHGVSRNNHRARRVTAKCLIFVRLFGWYVRHPRYALPFLCWSKFKWMAPRESTKA